MPFTTPSTFNVGQVVTATELNGQIRDNIRYLKGLDGPVQLDSSTFRLKDEQPSATNDTRIFRDSNRYELWIEGNRCFYVDLASAAGYVTYSSNNYQSYGRLTCGNNHHIDSYGGGGLYLNWFAGGSAGTAHVVVGNGAGAHGRIDAAVFNVQSEREAKTNIQEAHGAAVLDMVTRMKFHTFRFNHEGDDEPPHIGPLADDAPPMVRGSSSEAPVDETGDESREVLTLNLADMVGAALAAVKELADQVMTLREELADVRAASPIVR